MIHIAAWDKFETQECLRCGIEIPGEKTRRGTRVVEGPQGWITADVNWGRPDATDASFPACTLLPFKPSEIILGSLFAGCFGDAGAEIAALYMTLAMHFHGDEWKPVSAAMIRSAVEGLRVRMPWLSDLEKNPFRVPSFKALLDGGWVQDTPRGELSFKPHAVEAMLRHVCRRK